MEFYWGGSSKSEASSKINGDALYREALKLESEDALTLIDIVLKYCGEKDKYLLFKAELLRDLKRFEESEECYQRILNIVSDNKIIEDKAEMEYLWASQLLKTQNFTKALEIIDNTLFNLPHSADPQKYYLLKSSILQKLNQPLESEIYYYKSKGESDKLNKLKEFEKYKNETLITVTGTYMYQNFKPFKRGAILTLTKEPDNEFDSDAIRVENIKHQKVGYVANSPHTVMTHTKSATQIKDIIKDSQKAEVLMILLDKFVIARLISDEDALILSELLKNDTEINNYLGFD